MEAVNDDQGIKALEKKIDTGFAEMRAEFNAVRTEAKVTERELRGEILAARTDARSDFRTLVAVTVGMWVTTILAVLGVFLQHSV